MPEQVIRATSHAVVLAVLILLTLGSLAFSFADVSGSWHRGVALGVAASQACLVGLFYMHALTSSKLTWCVIAVSLFWLAAVLFTLTLADYFTRSAPPYVPGH